MKSGIASDGVFGGGHAEKTWSSFLSQEQAKAIVRSRSVGIADAVTRQILGPEGNRSSDAMPPTKSLQEYRRVR
jgi:Rod binding domain-containing protein